MGHYPKQSTHQQRIIRFLEKKIELRIFRRSTIVNYSLSFPNTVGNPLYTLPFKQSNTIQDFFRQI
jgi:hypothetical protein